MKECKSILTDVKDEKCCTNSAEKQCIDSKKEEKDKDKYKDKEMLIKEKFISSNLKLNSKEAEKDKDLHYPNDNNDNTNITLKQIKNPCIENDNKKAISDSKEKIHFSAISNTIPEGTNFESKNNISKESHLEEKLDQKNEETKKDSSFVFGPSNNLQNVFKKTGAGIFDNISNKSFPICDPKECFANLNNTNNLNKSDDDDDNDDNDDEEEEEEVGENNKKDSQKIIWDTIQNPNTIVEVSLPQNEFKKIFELKISKLKIDNINRGYGVISIEEPIENKSLHNIIVLRNNANLVVYQGFIIKKLSKIKINPKSKPGKVQAEFWVFSKKPASKNPKVKSKILDIILITFYSEKDKKSFVEEFLKLIDKKP